MNGLAPSYIEELSVPVATVAADATLKYLMISFHILDGITATEHSIWPV